jgi:hypothetical protein
MPPLKCAHADLARRLAEERLDLVALISEA